MKKVREKRNGIRALEERVRAGLKCAWAISPLLTVMRVFGTIASVGIVIVMSLFGKKLLELLIYSGDSKEKLQLIFTNLLLVGICKLLLEAVKHMLQYARNVHDKLIHNAGNSYTVSQMLYNSLTFTGAIVSFMLSVIVLFRCNLLYGCVTVIIGIPATISCVRWTKQIYAMASEQIIERYIKKVRDKSLCVCCVRVLHKLVVVLIAVDITLGILQGKNTAGDYVLYLGIVEQLWTCMYLLSQTGVSISGISLKKVVVD